MKAQKPEQVTKKQPEQNWESFPEPKGWSVKWDNTGLTNQHSTAKTKP